MRIRPITLLIGCIGIAAAAHIAGCGDKTDPRQSLADAQQAVERGDRKSAIVHLRNTLQVEPQWGEARYLLGTLYNETDDPVSGEKELRKAAELGIEPAKILPNVAWSLVMQGKHAEALKETEGSDPKSPEVLAEVMAVRGFAELALGRLPDAANSLEKALSLNPRSV